MQRSLSVPSSNSTDQTRLALAALTACLVKSLGGQDPALQAKFEANLEKAYNNIREMEARHIGALEILHWTREFLKEL
jgi:hypothetical protein